MKSLLAHLFIACAVGAAALIGYGIWYSTIAAASTAVAELQNRIVTETESANRIASVRSAIAELSVDELAVQNYFVSEVDAVAFINDIEARGRSQGTAVTVLSVSTGTDRSQPILALSLMVRGTFDAVMRTVGAIEYAPYALSISELSLAQDAKNNWSANLKLRVGSVSAAAAATPSDSDALGTSTP